MMCLRALGVDCDEDTVNRVLGAAPMKGASWEQVLACVQYYGMRGTLVCPSTIKQLKEWTDRGVPVIIAWNPEGRDWSHASVVFDVTDDHDVYVADPNIPDPEETVRVVPKGEFYKKWFEKWPNYLVRRPACAIEPEISSEGQFRFAKRGVPKGVYILPYDRIYISNDNMHKLLGLFLNHEKIPPNGWLIKTGNTQMDEVFFFRQGPAVKVEGKPDDEIVYEVHERGGWVFSNILLPALT